MSDPTENAAKPARTKRPRPLSDPERREKMARALSSRPLKIINKPTLTELAAVKYANGAMNHSAMKMKFKGLKKTMEETTENIKSASMKTAGSSYYQWWYFITRDILLTLSFKFTATEVLLPADTGFIRPDGNEKTFRLKQRDIISEVDMNTAKNAMDFQLTKFGPYNLNYSKNGRLVET